MKGGKAQVYTRIKEDTNKLHTTHKAHKRIKLTRKKELKFKTKNITQMINIVYNRWKDPFNRVEDIKLLNNYLPEYVATFHIINPSGNVKKTFNGGAPKKRPSNVNEPKPQVKQRAKRTKQKAEKTKENKQNTTHKRRTKKNEEIKARTNAIGVLETLGEWGSCTNPAEVALEKRRLVRLYARDKTEANAHDGTYPQTDEGIIKFEQLTEQTKKLLLNDGTEMATLRIIFMNMERVYFIMMDILDSKPFKDLTPSKLRKALMLLNIIIDDVFNPTECTKTITLLTDHLKSHTSTEEWEDFNKSLYCRMLHPVELEKLANVIISHKPGTIWNDTAVTFKSIAFYGEFRILKDRWFPSAKRIAIANNLGSMCDELVYDQATDKTNALDIDDFIGQLNSARVDSLAWNKIDIQGTNTNSVLFQVALGTFLTENGLCCVDDPSHIITAARWACARMLDDAIPRHGNFEDLLTKVKNIRRQHRGGIFGIGYIIEALKIKKKELDDLATLNEENMENMGITGLFKEKPTISLEVPPGEVKIIISLDDFNEFLGILETEKFTTTRLVLLTNEDFLLCKEFLMVNGECIVTINEQPDCVYNREALPVRARVGTLHADSMICECTLQDGNKKSFIDWYNLFMSNLAVSRIFRNIRLEQNFDCLMEHPPNTPPVDLSHKKKLIATDLAEIKRLIKLVKGTIYTELIGKFSVNHSLGWGDRERALLLICALCACIRILGDLDPFNIDICQFFNFNLSISSYTSKKERTIYSKKVASSIFEHLYRSLGIDSEFPDHNVTDLNDALTILRENVLIVSARSAVTSADTIKDVIRLVLERAPATHNKPNISSALTSLIYARAVSTVESRTRLALRHTNRTLAQFLNVAFGLRTDAPNDFLFLETVEKQCKFLEQSVLNDLPQYRLTRKQLNNAKQKAKKFKLMLQKQGIFVEDSNNNNENVNKQMGQPMVEPNVYIPESHRPKKLESSRRLRFSREPAKISLEASPNDLGSVGASSFGRDNRSLYGEGSVGASFGRDNRSLYGEGSVGASSFGRDNRSLYGEGSVGALPYSRDNCQGSMCNYNHFYQDSRLPGPKKKVDGIQRLLKLLNGPNLTSGFATPSPSDA
uniref:Uncharacterized protein n=1 Tax=viral metagenome TaxID=1070528 RepID=A0A6C0ETL4_9ZZZZ